MKKVELIDAIAKKAGLTKADTTKAFDATQEVIAANLAKGNKVPIIGFGTFDVSKRSAREARNPRTGEKIKIAARKAVTFKPGASLKARVNK